jgi:capsular polysaccharide transport system ATP-binding protein
MIRLLGISYALPNGATLFDNVTADIPTDRRVAILGGDYAGKTTLVQMLAGLTAPKRGQIERYASLSFPAGYLRGFRPSYSGRQNVMFAAKIYNADPDEVFDFVDKVTGFGARMENPMRAMAPQDRAKLSYVLTYALPFDCYLFDNSIGGIDPAFRARCEAMYEARTRTSGAIIATKQVRIARRHCDCAYVIRNGGLEFFDNLLAGIATFEADLKAAAPIARDDDDSLVGPEEAKI